MEQPGTTIFRKNLLFAKYGHECDLANELDPLPTVIPGNSLCARLDREVLRARMVSEISKQSLSFLRSQGAIACEKYRHLKISPCIIHPFSNARRWWESFICIIFFLQFILIPLDVAYFLIPDTPEVRNDYFKYIRMMCDCLCCVDVLMNFVTGYYNAQLQQTVLEPSSIARSYFTTYFVPDLLSSLPTHIDLFMEIEVEGVFFIALEILSVLKLMRIFTFFKYFRHFLETINASYTFTKIISLILISVIYFHFITCFLIFVYAICMGYFDELFGIPKGNGPKNCSSTDSSSLMDKHSYAGALYKATILICNTGYGSVAPKHTFEVIITCIVWVISRFLLVILIGCIIQIIKATNSAKHKYIEMVRQLCEYMRDKQLPEYMQRRLLTYYEFRFQKCYFRESEILATISGQLRQEIIMHSCRKLVENVAFFKNLPLNLLVRIVSCLRSEIFLVNDVIVRCNTSGDCMYFIASGTVAVFTSSGREICHLEDGAHFGEIALVMRDELRVASVIAVEVSELYKLDRKEFIRAIHPYPDLLDNIQRIAAERMEKTTMLDEHNRRNMAAKTM